MKLIDLDKETASFINELLEDGATSVTKWVRTVELPNGILAEIHMSIVTDPEDFIK